MAAASDMTRNPEEIRPHGGLLRWRCRRGMRELDDLLLRYLEQRYDDAPAAEKAAFSAFLELSDPELMGYLLQKQPPPAEFNLVVAFLLDRPHT